MTLLPQDHAQSTAVVTSGNDDNAKSGSSMSGDNTMREPFAVSVFMEKHPLWVKTFASLVFLVLAVCARTGVIDKAMYHSPVATFEQGAVDYLADIQKRAAVSFLAARGVSAVIEGLKTAEFSVVAVSIRPGQALEPINDLIDQFSTVMLVSLAAVGTQELILRIGAASGFTLFLPFALLAFAWRPWADKGKKQRWYKIGSGILIAAFFVRFFIPVVAGVGQHVTQTYLIEDYRQAVENVSGVEQKLHKLQKETVTPQKPAQAVPGKSQTGGAHTPPVVKQAPEAKGLAGLVAAMSRIAGKTVDSINKAFTLPDMKKLGELLSDMMDDIVTLIKIFVFETIVLPLLAGYVLLLLLRMISRIPG